MIGEEDEPSDVSRTSKKVFLPASSKWQSSFSCPLASTSLRAYLSPKNVKKLKAIGKAEREQLNEQYYSEAIKFSYIQGLYDSAEIKAGVSQKKRGGGLPQVLIDNVKEVIRDNDILPDKLRPGRRMVPGHSGTASSVGHNLLEHPEDADPSAIFPLKTTLTTGPGARWQVSGKIGSRPKRKDKVHGLTERTWAPTDLSTLQIQEGDSSAVQERAHGAGLFSADVCNPQIHAQPPKREVYGSSRPSQQKTGRSLRSGIVPLSGMLPPKRESLEGKRPAQQKTSGTVPLHGVSSLPLAPRLGPVSKQSVPIAAEVQPLSAAMAPQHERTAPARLQSLPQPSVPQAQAGVPAAAPNAQTAPVPSVKAWNAHSEKLTASRLQTLQQQTASQVQPKAEVAAEGSTAQKGERLPQKLVRKAREAAYMPLVSWKPKLMDQVEKTLFGVGIKALTLEKRSALSNVSTATH